MRKMKLIEIIIILSNILSFKIFQKEKKIITNLFHFRSLEMTSPSPLSPPKRTYFPNY